MSKRWQERGISMEDWELERRAIAREEEAFVVLLQQHKQALLRTGYAFLKNEADVLEALQEVTYRAYKKIHTIKEPAYVKTWLIRVMINYCQDELKKKSRFVSGIETPNTAGAADFAQLELQDVLASLSESEQQLIYMKYFQGIKIKDIAALERIPEGTVKSRLHKTLRSLRRHFENKGGMGHV